MSGAGLGVVLAVALAATLGVPARRAHAETPAAGHACGTEDLLAGKLPVVSPDEITPEMLAIETSPTDAELDAIKALSRGQHKCRQHLRAVTQEHEPTRVATHDELSMKLDLVTAELLQKKMSYGNANRLYREAALEASNKLTQQAKDELADAEEREAATWRSLGQSLAGAAKPPAPKADRSCSWVDSSVDCRAH